MKRKIACTLSLCFFLSTMSVRAQMRIHLIDIGQGSATLVEFPCAAILIDAGGEDDTLFHASQALKNYLDDFFKRRADLNHTLQCVYLTHPHIDHTLGVPVILKPPFVIKNAVTDGLERGTGVEGQVSLHQAAQAGNATPETADDIGFEAVHTDEIGPSGLTNAVIDPVDCGDVDPVITIFWGTSVTNPGWSKAAFQNENNHSLVIKIETSKASVLLTGDLEDTALETFISKYSGTKVLDADVYLVGHHGSKNGTTEALLDMITPKIALIGMGDPKRKTSWTAWAYGHPNKGVLDMLSEKLTEKRESIKVQAGLGARKFVPYTVSKAIYAVGWDGNVVLEANAAGDWRRTGTAADPLFIDINTANLFELEGLPGVNLVKGQAIVDFRAKNGKYAQIEDLLHVPGICPATFNLIRPYVRVAH